jgi:tetratricopeptide (TPR) repeat protein
MKLPKSLCAVLVLLVAIFLSHCAPTAKVPITRPAEINLSQFDKIAVGDIEGNAGFLLTSDLTAKLFESSYFEVLDRQNLQKIMNEHSLNLSGAVDSDTAAAVGKIIGVSALIFGRSDVGFNHDRRVGKELKNKDGSTYRYYHIKSTGMLKTNLRVVDLMTGKIVAVKSFTKNKKTERRARNQWPERPDTNTMLNKMIASSIDDFMRMIAPYTDYVRVKFTDSDLPEAKAGIDAAKNGNWRAALTRFKMARDKAPNVAGNWYNLGLGYLYNFKYEEALQALEKAYALEPEKQYLSEMDNVKRIKAQQDALQDQGYLKK